MEHFHRFFTELIADEAVEEFFANFSREKQRVLTFDQIEKNAMMRFQITKQPVTLEVKITACGHEFIAKECYHWEPLEGYRFERNAAMPVTKSYRAVLCAKCKKTWMML